MLDPEVVIPRPNQQQDIFSKRLVLPDEVYILGSGINGRAYHDCIPDECYLISLNRAICITPCSLWMQKTTDPSYISEPWFTEALKCPDPKAFGWELTSRVRNVNIAYTFWHEPDYWKEPSPFDFIYGLLREGGTIAGMALQLCYWKGVKRVVLCGIDMKGHTHWDEQGGSVRGTVPLNECLDYNADKVIDGIDQEWGRELQMLQLMVDMCKASGMTIQSLSETALEVERL